MSSYRERMSGGRGDDRGGRDEGRGRDSRDDRGSRETRTSHDRGRDSGRDEGRGRDRDSGRSGRGTGFVYRQRSAEAVTKRAEGTSQYDQFLRADVKMFKAHDRINNVRLVPPTWEGAEHYGLDIWVHYGVGPDRQTYLCLHKMKGEPCPICDERVEAARDRDDEYAKELEPKRRVLTYLVDRDDEREGLQAWPMPQGTDQDIVQVMVDRRTGEVIPIDDPEEGYDISFNKSGAGIKTRYEGIAIDRRPSRLGKDEWLQQAIDNPLPDILQYFSYDHIAAEFKGGGGHSNKRDQEAGNDRGRDSGRGDDRGRDSGRDSGRGGARDDRGGDAPLTWDQIHRMAGRELDDLIELERLNINPSEAKDDADLADWICEEMGLQRPAGATASSGRTRVRVDEPAADTPASSVRDRLAGLRGRG